MEGAISGIGGFRDIGNPNDRRRGIGPRPIVAGMSNEELAVEMLAALAERDPETQAPASLYPQRMSLDDRDLAESVQNLPRYGLSRERDVRPETKKVLRKEGVDPESQFRLGQKIKDTFTPEVAAYGGVQIPVRGADGQVRSAKTIYSNKESYDEAPSLADEVKRSRMENKTPLTNLATLQRLAKEGKFVHMPGDGTYFGYIIDGVNKETGEVVARDVYAPKALEAEGLFRVGNPANRDYDAIRSDLKAIDPRLGSGISTRGGSAKETGLVPFLDNEEVYSKIGGLRRGYEGRPAGFGRKTPEMSQKYGMPFNELLEELQYGSFMDKPTVVNAFRSLEANDPDIERRIMSLKMAAERTTIPEKAAALGRAATNLETGIALVRSERMGREVDIQAFTPDFDPAPGVTDVAAEIAEMASPEYADADYDSIGEDRVEMRGGNSGFSIERARAVPEAPRDAVAMSGPVTESFDPDFPVGDSSKPSGMELAALRAKYQNPDVARIARATSQPEIDITNDVIQQAFDERLALLGQAREQAAPDTGTALNAPASTGSVDDQQRVIDAMPQGVRQNVVRGLAEGASEPSRNAAVEFMNRFRNRMFSR